jgi:hypothetical protein
MLTKKQARAEKIAKSIRKGRFRLRMKMRIMRIMRIMRMRMRMMEMNLDRT